MSDATRKVLLWTPRVLAIVVAIFLTTFALDAFGEERGFWASLPGFLLHLSPTVILVATIYVAWRHAWFGALIFLSLAAIYVVTMLDHPRWILAIAGPLALTGLMYLMSWRTEDASRPPSDSSATR